MATTRIFTKEQLKKSKCNKQKTQVSHPSAELKLASQDYINNIKRLFLEENLSVKAIAEQLNCPVYFVNSVIEPHSVYAEPLGSGKKGTFN